METSSTNNINPQKDKINFEIDSQLRCVAGVVASFVGALLLAISLWAIPSGYGGIQIVLGTISLLHMGIAVVCFQTSAKKVAASVIEKPIS